MSAFRIATLAAFAWPTLGCHHVTFTSSSIDHNRGRPHAVIVNARRIDEVLRRLVPIAQQRDLRLTRQHNCNQQSCLLVLSTPGWNSRYFATLRRKAEGQFTVAMVGVPVHKGVTACPSALSKVGRCKPKRVRRINPTLSEDAGHDVTGSTEAALIVEILTRLKLALNQPRQQKARPKQKVVAVLDIEAPPSLLRGGAVRQLSLYLAAKVATQRYYRLVPRDVLQAELARRRRTSYRACYQKRCQVAIGQALAADSVLATKVLRVGERCAISAMLYDLRTEATERAALVKTACAEAALLAGIDRTAKQLED